LASAAKPAADAMEAEFERKSRREAPGLQNMKIPLVYGLADRLIRLPARQPRIWGFR
jgi:hypothetical protein